MGTAPQSCEFFNFVGYLHFAVAAVAVAAARCISISRLAKGSALVKLYGAL
jgi:hypothetical protein